MYKYLLLLSLIITGCGEDNEGSKTTGGSGRNSGSGSASYSDLPLITSFASTPSDQFILDSDGLTKVSRAMPWYGASTECAASSSGLGGHTGGHVHFTQTGAPYEVNIYAIADGYVTRVDTCYGASFTDRYGIDIAIGKTASGDNVTFHYSIEPLENGQTNPHPCSDESYGDPNYFAQYIFVEEGQKVSKGDLIAKYPKYAGQSDDGAHIHFNLLTDDGQKCPNIFNSQVTTDFAASPDDGLLKCYTTNIDPTFCYMPDAGEDIVTP